MYIYTGLAPVHHHKYYGIFKSQNKNIYQNIFWHICYTHSSNCLIFDVIYVPLFTELYGKHFAIRFTLHFDMFAVILMYTKFCASICQSAQMWQRGDVHATNTLKKFKYFVYKYTFLYSVGCVLVCVCVFEP